jgi:hypothetical protein
MICRFPSDHLFKEQGKRRIEREQECCHGESAASSSSSQQLFPMTILAISLS